jgi:hypothetical protein
LLAHSTTEGISFQSNLFELVTERKNEGPEQEETDTSRARVLCATRHRSIVKLLNRLADFLSFIVTFIHLVFQLLIFLFVVFKRVKNRFFEVVDLLKVKEERQQVTNRNLFPVQR